MDDKAVTGAEYPTVELGGTVYEVKFTRGLMYRLTKAGITFNPHITRSSAVVSLDVMIDVLKLAIGFPGTPEELTELAYDKRGEIMTILLDGWGKVVLPSLQAQIAAAAAKTPSDQPLIQ